MKYFRARPSGQPVQAQQQDDDLELTKHQPHPATQVFQPRFYTPTRLILLVISILTVLLLAVVSSANDVTSPIVVPHTPHTELVANSNTNDAATDTIEDALAPLAIVNPSFEERDETGFARARDIENGSVPFYPIDWSVDVGVWWDRHPLNPDNGGFDPASVIHP